MTGLFILVGALVLAVVSALVLKFKNGRFAAKPPGPAVEVLTAADIGAPLGERATLVQFSSAFCSPCRATRTLLTDVVRTAEGVVTVEIDAESHLDLVRTMNIMRTPTVLVLDSAGAVTTRASGLPRREQVLAALHHSIENGTR